MKIPRLSMFLLILLFFKFSFLRAQENKGKDLDDNELKPSEKIDKTNAVDDKIIFKDGGNTLLEINSESSGGSLLLTTVNSVLSGAKLYNNGGNLY